jgi:hypothetical protein
MENEVLITGMFLGAGLLASVVIPGLLVIEDHRVLDHMVRGSEDFPCLASSRVIIQKIGEENSGRPDVVGGRGERGVNPFLQPDHKVNNIRNSPVRLIFSVHLSVSSLFFQTVG